MKFPEEKGTHMYMTCILYRTYYFIYDHIYLVIVCTRFFYTEIPYCTIACSLSISIFCMFHIERKKLQVLKYILEVLTSEVIKSTKAKEILKCLNLNC